MYDYTERINLVFSKRKDRLYDPFMTDILHDKIYDIINKNFKIYEKYFKTDIELCDNKNKILFKLYKKNKENLNDLDYTEL